MSFLKYTGIIDYNKNTRNYCFQMEDKTELLDKIYMNIPKPITDINFKEVFGKNPEIAKSLINSFLFPKTNKIKNIEYISLELQRKIGVFPEAPNKYDFDLLRVDIFFRCTLDEERSKEENEEDSKDNSEVGSKMKNDKNIDNTYIIDLEIQIGFSTERTRQLLNYIKKLDLKYKDRIIVLSLVNKESLNPKKNNSSMTSLQEQSEFDYKNIYEYDDYIIYQIDLDYCRKKITSNNGDLWLTEENEKLNDYTKEWVKYLTLSTWCKSYKNDYYALPTLTKKFFKNNYIYEAISILYNQDEVYYQMDLYDQQVKEKNIKKFKEQEKKLQELKDKNEENKKLIKKIKELETQLHHKKKKNIEKKRKTPLANSNSYDKNSNSSDSNSNSSYNS